MISDFTIAIIILIIVGLALLDVLALRWLRSRSNRKFELQRDPLSFLPSGRKNRNYPNSDTPPCWPYGWPGEGKDD